MSEAISEPPVEPEAGVTSGSDDAGDASAPPHKPRRRGSRGGRNRKRPASGAAAVETPSDDADPRPELPERMSENRPSAEAAERALVRKPQIGDSRPAPARSSRPSPGSDGDEAPAPARKRRRRGGRGRSAAARTAEAARDDEPVELDEETLERRRGRERKGRPVGRYLMCVHVRPHATQIAVLEGRSLIEFYVSRPQDDATQIHGNIYLGRVQNVLPGMEAAFVDIGTPKNAVLYRGDVRYDQDDVVEGGDGGNGNKKDARIEQLLRPGQTILCQVTKNPIGTKG